MPKCSHSGDWFGQPKDFCYSYNPGGGYSASGADIGQKCNPPQPDCCTVAPSVFKEKCRLHPVNSLVTSTHSVRVDADGGSHEGALTMFIALLTAYGLFLLLLLVVGIFVSRWLSKTLGINFWIVFLLGTFFPPAYIIMIIAAIVIITRTKSNRNRSTTRHSIRK